MTYLVRNCYNNTRKSYQINKPQVQAQPFRLPVKQLLKLEKIEIEKVEHLDEDQSQLTKKSMKVKRQKKTNGNEVLEVQEANVQIFH